MSDAPGHPPAASPGRWSWHADAERVARVLRRNALYAVVLAVLLVLAAVGVVLVLVADDGSVLGAVVLGVVGLIVAAALAQALAQRRTLRRQTGASGVVLAADDAALTVGATTIPWSDLRGVGIVDVRAATAEALDPQTGQVTARVGSTVGTAVSMRTGNGSVAVVAVARETVAVAPSGWGRTVATSTVDVPLGPQAVAEILRVLPGIVTAHGVPLEASTDRLGVPQVVETLTTQR